MVDRLTQGPAQIFNLDVSSINYALRDLSERIDELSGLRGRAMIYDRFLLFLFLFNAAFA